MTTTSIRSLPTAYFVTGTDTDSGKTAITCALMRMTAARGLTIAGMKPIAAGAEVTSAGLRNDDAIAIQQQCSHPVAYEQINPVCFEKPIAPHLQQVPGVAKEQLYKPILKAFHTLRNTADVTIIEGVGGWRTPLSQDTDVAGLCAQLQLPVILVVGMRLGCVNHAILSVESIHHSGIPLLGWIANQIDPGMLAVEDNIAALQTYIDAPLLGSVPFLKDFSIDAVADHLGKQ